ISKVSLLNGNVLLDFKKEAKQRLELTHDMTEDEAREKLEAFYESLDEEGKEKLDALLERTDDLIGNLSAIEYAETVEASFAAVKGKGKEDLLNKNTSGDNPKITAYINSLAHLYKPEDSEKARNVLQNMFDSSQKLRGLIERETDTRKLSPIFVTALSIGWDQLGMEPPQRLPMAEQTANAGQTQAQANETLRRLQGEGTRVPQTGTLEASTGLQDEQEAILVESVNNTPEAVRLGVDKKLETTIDNKTALRFTTDQFISYLKNNPLKPEEILDGNFESTLAIVESLIKTGGVPSELPPASRDVLVKIINPMLPTGWNIDNVKLGDNKAEIRFTKEGVETTGLEASTPVPERNEENEARLNEMISSLPEVEQREIMGQPINEYLSDFADTLAELRKPPHNLSRSDADKLLGAATIVQRETASLPDVMAYYKIVEDNKDNPALKAGLETGAAIVFDANTTIPRLEQSQDGPKIHMLRSTARFIVGRESAINADKAIKEMLETGKTETQAEELAAYIESMLGIIQGRRNVNQ
ncbi:MAG TPA: hypothetical protein VHE53_00500, partial [Patescibacteria group bacterium]|nr:hypothetical protein [Patescibacteria group bacterium]